jgi:hypothetical protein
MHAIEVMYYIFKVFGLAPFKLRKERLRRKVILNTELRENLLYNVWLLLLLSLIIFGGIKQFIVVLKFSSTGVVSVGAFSTLISFPSSLTSLIIVNFKRNLATTILTKLYKIDQVLFKNEEQISESKKTQNMVLTKIYILIISGAICMTFALASWGEVFGYFQETLLWISNFISIIILIQVFGCVSYVQNRLAILNTAMLSVFKTGSDGMCSVHRKCTHRSKYRVICDLPQSVNTQKHYISVINSNYSDMFHSGAPASQDSASFKILELRNAYNMIYEFFGIVSSIYGFPILLQLAHNFLVLVGVSYVFITFFYSDKSVSGPINYDSVRLRVSITLWLVISFVKLLIVTVSCENVISENKRLSDGVHKLLLRSDLTADSMCQLQLLSFQLLSYEMKFSAAGLFSVNLSYLHSSLSAVVTYIVVLVQVK